MDEELIDINEDDEKIELNYQEGIIDKLEVLTRNLLNNIYVDEYRDFYGILSMCYFVLLKEKILKKNSKDKYLVYNEKEGKKYEDYILFIYDYVMKYGEFQSNIEIKNIDKDLKKPLLLVNKIRDAIVHGNYTYNPKRKLIKFNSSFQDKNNNKEIDKDRSYKLICEIPLEILNSYRDIMYPENNRKRMLDMYSQMDTKQFMNFIKIEEDKFTETFKNNLYKNINDYLNNNITDFTFNDLNFTNMKTFGSNYCKKKDYEKIKILEFMCNEVKDYKILNYLVKSQIKYVYDTSEIHANYDADTLLHYINPLLINEEDEMPNEALIALYLYMFITFKENININYAQIKTKCLLFKFDNEYDEIKLKIQNKCKRFNENINNCLENYNKCTNIKNKEQFRINLILSIYDFYQSIINDFYTKNKKIVTSLRNSVEHGNFLLLNPDVVILNDKIDQNIEDDKKFTCVTNLPTLFRVTSEINDEYLKDGYKVGDLFKELKHTIDRKIYDETYKNIKKLNEIVLNRKINEQEYLYDLSYEKENRSYVKRRK